MQEAETELYYAIQGLRSDLIDHSWSRRLTTHDSEFISNCIKRLQVIENASFKLTNAYRVQNKPIEKGLGRER